MFVGWVGPTSTRPTKTAQSRHLLPHLFSIATSHRRQRATCHHPVGPPGRCLHVDGLDNDFLQQQRDLSLQVLGHTDLAFIQFGAVSSVSSFVRGPMAVSPGCRNTRTKKTRLLWTHRPQMRSFLPGFRAWGHTNHGFFVKKQWSQTTRLSDRSRLPSEQRTNSFWTAMLVGKKERRSMCLAACVVDLIVQSSKGHENPL